MKRQSLWVVGSGALAAALVGSLLVLAQTAPLASKDAAVALPAKTDDEGAVKVSVTPQDLSKSAKAWRFDVQFNTHVKPISQDMVAVASLSDGKAAEERPTAWEGDPPGGHHRHGVLVFEPLDPATATVTLRIREVGDVAERTFTWNLGGS